MDKNGSKILATRMWMVETENGIAYIGRDAPGAQKGHFWNYATKGLGYPPIFIHKKDALKFARKIRKTSTTAKHTEIVEVEFYKGELK